jgi:hypothetical protein
MPEAGREILLEVSPLVFRGALSAKVEVKPRKSIPFVENVGERSVA